jgi:EAL domain-containing protein (putative c-di-GMP-specific phosphodiesterase class I)
MNDRQQRLVRDLVKMFSNLDIQTVAEGIETREVLWAAQDAPVEEIAQTGAMILYP